MDSPPRGNHGSHPALLTMIEVRDYNQIPHATRGKQISRENMFTQRVFSPAHNAAKNWGRGLPVLCCSPWQPEFFFWSSTKSSLALSFSQERPGMWERMTFGGRWPHTAVVPVLEQGSARSTVQSSPILKQVAKAANPADHTGRMNGFSLPPLQRHRGSRYVLLASPVNRTLEWDKWVGNVCNSVEPSCTPEQIEVYIESRKPHEECSFFE